MKKPLLTADQARKAESLLRENPNEIASWMAGLDARACVAAMDCMGSLSLEAIQCKGDYSLAMNMMHHLPNVDPGSVLGTSGSAWLGARSPLGVRHDFEQQQQLYLSVNWRTTLGSADFYGQFGKYRAHDVLEASDRPEMDGPAFRGFSRGSVSWGPKVALACLALAPDQNSVEEASHNVVSGLLQQDSEGASVAIGKMPEGTAKDHAILAMVEWLCEKNSTEEARHWLPQIQTTNLRQRAEQTLKSSGPSNNCP